MTTATATLERSPRLTRLIAAGRQNGSLSTEAVVKALPTEVGEAELDELDGGRIATGSGRVRERWRFEACQSIAPDVEKVVKRKPGPQACLGLN
jgi:hypothetical protein